MPDWVSNDLQITGPEAELQRFVAECFTVESTGLRFDFDKLIPIPAALKGTPGQDGTQGDVYGLGLGEGLFPDWYVWVDQELGHEMERSSH